MSYLGDFRGGTDSPVHALFTTIKACGVPVALVSGAARTIKNGLASGLHATGVTLTQSAGSITGLNKIVVLTSGTLYGSGNYDIILSTGSVNGINVRGYLIGTFSIRARAAPTATDIWAVTSRLLTSGAVMWTAAGRTLSSGSVVWSAATRTLTSGGAPATSVWAAATRTLTSGSIVWSAATRTLTSGGAPATSVWAAATRTLTSGAVAWTAAGRTLSSGQIVWNAATRILTSGGAVWDANLTELAVLPGAAPTSDQSIMLLYQGLRNKRITTATADKIHTSATAVVATAVVSFVTGTQTFTKNKYA